MHKIKSNHDSSSRPASACKNAPHSRHDAADDLRELQLADLAITPIVGLGVQLRDSPAAAVPRDAIAEKEKMRSG